MSDHHIKRINEKSIELIKEFDVQRKEVKQLSISYDQIVKTGTTAKWSATSDYNQFIDSDKALKSKNIEDLKIQWIPEKIIFVDNSTLE